MYVCMYVYMYVCMHVCMYVCMYVYIYIYVCMYVKRHAVMREACGHERGMRACKSHAVMKTQSPVPVGTLELRCLCRAAS